MVKRKKILAALMISALSVSMAACGGEKAGTQTADTSAPEEKVEAEPVASPEYANYDFDFSEDIDSEMAAVSLVPEAAEAKIAVEDAKGASGVELAAASDTSNTTDMYLNTFVAGNDLVISAKESALKTVNSSISGDASISDGKARVKLSALGIADKSDEVISVELEDGTIYRIHTLNEMLSSMEISGEGVAESDAGVYTMALDKFLIRVNSQGEIVYYRNVNCVGENLMAENFAPQDSEDGRYYSYFVELRSEYRNANGGFSSGMYVVMDENYTDVDQVVLAENDDKNHTHGKGYLDQHEFLVMGDNHYMTLSYTPLYVDNLPSDVAGTGDGHSGYVWVGIFQEVNDGKVVNEINTADYPMLYSSAVEKMDYANSTDQGVTVTVGQNEIPSLADGWMDYVHVNSLDYTLDQDGQVDKLLVSMRDQSAVYQFDYKTGNIEWILGGKASSLTGYEEYTSKRTDDAEQEFDALTFGQHFARYINKNADGTLTENPVISVFDNQTGMGPFLTALPVPTLTRTFVVTIDEAAKTATVSKVVNGTDLNTKTDKYHIASHCGSVEYTSDTSVLIGWGLHGVIDNIGAFAPEGTISDQGYTDLRQGSRPVFTDYNLEQETVSLELTATRNPAVQSHEAFFSYRTYKTAK